MQQSPSVLNLDRRYSHSGTFVRYTKHVMLHKYPQDIISLKNVYRQCSSAMFLGLIEIRSACYGQTHRALKLAENARLDII